VGGQGASSPSSGNWSSTGFSWAALKDDLSAYEVIISSEKLQVEGRFSLTSVSLSEPFQNNCLVTDRGNRHWDLTCHVVLHPNQQHWNLLLISDGRP
jgi:hypothetical protein